MDANRRTTLGRGRSSRLSAERNSARLRFEALESRCLLAALVLSDAEQLLVELVNRARANPAGEAARYGIDLNQGLAAGTISADAKQPLAPSQILVDIAREHSQEMLDFDYFDHTDLAGRSPSGRALAANYPLGVGENIAWRGSTGPIDVADETWQLHAGLFKSPGHRANLLNAGYREIGTGVRSGVFSYQGTGYNAAMATENFGSPPGDQAITGVAFSDTVSTDGFYSIGEGLGGVRLTARQAGSSTVYTTTTGPSGGFALNVPSGSYTLTAKGAPLGSAVITLTDVVVATENVKADIVTPYAMPLDDLATRSSDGSWQLLRSTGAGFETQPGGSWSTGSAAWLDVRAADVNGDARLDIVGRSAGDGRWWVGLNDGAGFIEQAWGRWAVTTWKDVSVGDFDGDGRDDLAGRTAGGQWWVARSTGSGFVNQLWGAWHPSVDWLDVQVGDFDGDGRQDLAGRAANTGQWWIGRSSGGSFVNENWARWSAATNWLDVRVGDFNGDGRDDVAGRAASSGQWWLAKSNGAGAFVNENWGRWAVTNWADVSVGDFDGDGNQDLIGRVASSGQWWLAASDGSGLFENRYWGRWSAIPWQDVRVGDFSGDGRHDLIGRTPSGDLWVARSDSADRFVNEYWGRWSDELTLLDLLVDDFTR